MITYMQESSSIAMLFGALRNAYIYHMTIAQTLSPDIPSLLNVCAHKTTIVSYKHCRNFKTERL